MLCGVHESVLISTSVLHLKSQLGLRLHHVDYECTFDFINKVLYIVPKFVNQLESIEIRATVYKKKQ